MAKTNSKRTQHLNKNIKLEDFQGRKTHDSGQPFLRLDNKIHNKINKLDSENLLRCERTKQAYEEKN